MCGIFSYCSWIAAKEMVCTKTLYNYVDHGIPKIKNIDLPQKLRRKPRKDTPNNSYKQEKVWQQYRRTSRLCCFPWTLRQLGTQSGHRLKQWKRPCAYDPAEKKNRYLQTINEQIPKSAQMPLFTPREYFEQKSLVKHNSWNNCIFHRMSRHIWKLCSTENG